MADTAAAITTPLTTDDAWAIHQGPRFSTNSTTLNGTFILDVLHEQVDVEAIYMAAGTAYGAGTIRFWTSPSGTALASGTALSAAEDLTAIASNTSKKITLTGNTLIPAGNRIGFVAASADTHGVGFCISFKYRKGGYITNSDSKKVYMQGLDPAQPSQYAL